MVLHFFAHLVLSWLSSWFWSWLWSHLNLGLEVGSGEKRFPFCPLCVFGMTKSKEQKERLIGKRFASGGEKFLIAVSFLFITETMGFCSVCGYTDIETVSSEKRDSAKT